MSKFLVLLGLFVLIFDTPKSQVVNDEQSFFDCSYDRQQVRKNKVESVTMDSYSKGKISSQQIFYFDSTGLITKQIITNNIGKRARMFRFAFNKRGDLIRRTQVDDELHKTYIVNFYKQYFNGLLVKDSTDEMPVTEEYFYNEKGQKTRTIVTSNFGTVFKRIITYTLDTLGWPERITEKEFQLQQDSVGILFSDRTVFYNKTGHIYREEETLTGPNAWMANKGSIRYTYDDRNNLIEIIRSNAATYKYTYDDRGLITSKNMQPALDKSHFESGDRFSYKFRN